VSVTIFFPKISIGAVSERSVLIQKIVFAIGLSLGLEGRLTSIFRASLFMVIFTITTIKKL
jgi:hypothetical protein